MKKCDEIIEQISPYLDNELDENAMSEFEEHIESCEKCRKELHEMSIIVNLCRNTPQEDLPDNFSEDLHKKLIAEKEKIGRDNKTIRIFGRYAGIISSVAALLLIVFISRGIWFNSRNFDTTSSDNKVSLNNPENKSNRNNENMKDTVQFDTKQNGQDKRGSTPVPDSANSLVSKDISGSTKIDPVLPENSGTVNKSGSVVSPENKASERSAVSAGSLPAGKAGMSYSLQTSLPSPSSDSKLNMSFDKDTMAPLKSATNIVTKSTEISLYDNNPDGQTEKIKGYISECEGEMILPAALAPKAFTDSPQSVIHMKIPDLQYNKFVELIKSAYGSQNITIGELKSQDVTLTVNGLYSTLSEMDNKINQYVSGETTPDSKDLQALKDERDKIASEIKTYENSNGYTFISIITKRK